MDDVIKAIRNNQVSKVNIGYNGLKPLGLSVCAFADNLMICAPKESDRTA